MPFQCGHWKPLDSFLAMLHGMRDLSFPHQGWNLCLLHWKLSILTSRSPEKSPFCLLCTYSQRSHKCLWSVQIMWSLGSVRSYQHALKLLVNLLELWGDTGISCLCISYMLNFHLCISTQTQQISMVAECWEVWFPTQGQNSLTWGLSWRSSDWDNVLLMQGVWVQSLVSELGSHMPCNLAKR